jgi:hypothetical protein
MSRETYVIPFLAFLICAGCARIPESKKTVFAIPVYGQSLALGEEAIRITNFDSLSKLTNGHVLTENLDEEFGFFSDTRFKQRIKKVLGDRTRAFELSIYGMSEVVSAHLKASGLGDSIVISTFPGGQGATSIRDMGRGSRPYKKFLAEIKDANEAARRRGWKFEVPAFCWMQGENDIVWDKPGDYKKDLKNFHLDLNRDVKAITNQIRDVSCILYQTNCLTLSTDFDGNSFESRETLIPQSQLEILRDDKLFVASGPTYPYSFVGERVHLDGLSQKRLGYLAGLAVIRLLESKPNDGVIPTKFTVVDNVVMIHFNVPFPPLVLDTINVSKVLDYGFSVVNSENVNILEKVNVENNILKLTCTKSPVGSKVRYAINGIKGKSGRKHGPRGNLRDSQGQTLTATILKKSYPLHNWSYQFDELVR